MADLALCFQLSLKKNNNNMSWIILCVYVQSDSSVTTRMIIGYGQIFAKIVQE